MKWEHLRNQPEGVQFTNKDGKVTINDLDLNLNNDDDNDSSASDEGFDHDKEYQEEFEKKEKTRFEALATDEVQDNHFQLPFQQYQALLTLNQSKLRNEKLRSVKGEKSRKPTSVSGVSSNEANGGMIVMMTTVTTIMILMTGPTQEFGVQWMKLRYIQMK